MGIKDKFLIQAENKRKTGKQPLSDVYEEGGTIYFHHQDDDDYLPLYSEGEKGGRCCIFWQV